MTSVQADSPDGLMFIGGRMGYIFHGASTLEAREKTRQNDAYSTIRDS
jgi:hypothetical protein